MLAQPLWMSINMHGYKERSIRISDVYSINCYMQCFLHSRSLNTCCPGVWNWATLGLLWYLGLFLSVQAQARWGRGEPGKAGAESAGWEGGRKQNSHRLLVRAWEKRKSVPRSASFHPTSSTRPPVTDQGCTVPALTLWGRTGARTLTDSTFGH